MRNMFPALLLSLSWSLLPRIASSSYLDQEESWLGIYVQGSKVGHIYFSSANESLDGNAVKRTDTSTVFNMRMLGSGMEMKMDSTTWLDSKNRPLKMRFLTLSAGRTQTVLATFHGQKIEASMQSGGSTTKKVLDIPVGATIVDDAMTAFMEGTAPAIGTKRSFLVFDPSTVSLVTNSVTYQGKSKTKISGKEIDAILVLVSDPRADSRVFVSAKGDLIKVEGPMGMEMIAESKEKALSPQDASVAPPDLAKVSSIETTPPIKDPLHTSALELQVDGVDLKRMPSDEHQSVKEVDGHWFIDVHPIVPDRSKSSAIEQAQAGKPEWSKPSMHLPSDSQTFLALAKSIVGDRHNVVDAALRIKDYVYSEMTPNASIAVLRDAGEILKSKEGVCRDYAMLTATIMRAAGIPTRLVNGLVNWEGKFYYHAWVEAWDGQRWLGFDSTRPENALSATHIKISQGSVEEAYIFFLLEGAKLKVLNVRYR